MKLLASFDDGSVEDITLADMMKSHGIETTFYFPFFPQEVNEPRGRASLSEHQRQVIAADHEIGSHTLRHPLLTRVPLEVAKQEIEQSKAYLEKEFGREITAFSYPRGYANPEIQQMVKDAGYTHARGVTVGFLDKSENPFYEQTTVHVGCDRKEYGGLGWYDYALKMLEQATDDSVFHLWGHGWEIGQRVGDMDLLDKLCNQLTARRN